MTLKLFDYATLSGRVVRLTNESTQYGGCWSAQSVSPSHTDGYAPHRVQKYMVKPIEVGKTVCKYMKFEHYCGLIHLTKDEVEEITRWNPSVLSEMKSE